MAHVPRKRKLKTLLPLSIIRCALIFSKHIPIIMDFGSFNKALRSRVELLILIIIFVDVIIVPL